MKNKVKATVSLTLVVLMLLSVTAPASLGILPGTVTAAAASGDDVDKDSFLSYNAEPEGFRTATDPFGYGVGKAFPYITQNETFYYEYKDGTQYAGIFNKMKGTQRSFDTSTDVTGTIDDWPKLNFTQATAFDGDATGRDSYVAVVGVDSSQFIRVYIYDAANNRRIANVSLDKETNIKNDTAFYQASNHLSIVAGDFDGDGKDTIVVYATVTADANDKYNSYRFGLFEINPTYDSKGKMNGASLANTSGAKALINQTYLGLDKSLTLSSEYRADERNKPCVSMAVGDINNDKIDDLVVLSYMDHFAEQKKQTDFKASVPYLAVSYGKAGKTSAVGTRDEAFYVCKGGSGTYNTMASPGVAVTNVNGEGGDEVIVAGEALEIETGDGGKYWDDTYTETIRIARFSYTGSGLERNYIQDGEAENTLTENSIYSDDSVYAQIKVAGVYAKGRGNAAYVFINGDFYDLSTENTVTKAYTYGEIDKKPSGITVQCIYSYAVGNFDHNDKGYQQIGFLVAEKEKGEDDYDIYWAVVGVKDDGSFYGTTDLRKSGSATVVCTNCGDDMDEYLGALVVAVDCDNDGIIAKYNGLEYHYSDPDVIAVLQAGPYFDDIGDYYSNNNETTYSLKEIQSFEEAKSDNVSFSVCATVSVDARVVAASVSAGYALDWTQTFSDSITYTIEKAWTAQGEDTVVVYRTPVFVYRYDVLDTSGTWKDSELCMMVEKKPVFTTMTVDEYNDFCDAYNNQKNVKDYNAAKKNAGQSEMVYTMTKLNADSLKLGTEGNPFGYYNLNNMPGSVKTYGDLQQPGTSDSSTSVSYSIEKVESQSTEIGHGLHFGASIAAGNAVVKVGVETSLDYLHSKSSTESIGYGTEFDCNIQNPVKSAMMADGYSEAQVKAYTFNWKLASWNSNIPAVKKGSTQQYVPVIGYALSGVSSLPHPPTNLKATALDTDEDGLKDVIDVSWDACDSSDGYPAVSKYNVYLEDEDGERTLIKSNFSGTSFRYTITDSRKTTTFAVRGVYNALETLECKYDCDSANDQVNINSIDKVATNGLVDTYKITYTGTKAPSYFYVTNGADGNDGADGETAYEAACKNGYQGTKEQWLAVIGANCQISGHAYTEYTVPASCGVDGFTLKVCTVCGGTECTKINALTHKYTDITVKPTCYAGGYTIHKCENCGDFSMDNFVPALGHKYTATVTEPDCVNAGYTTFVCERCGEKHMDDSVKAKGHDYIAVVTDPTCVDCGYTTYTCKVCGEKYIDNVVKATGHDFKATVTKPTCTDYGYTTYVCRECGETKTDDLVPALGHHYEATVTAPTCCEKGYTTYTCDTCGDSYVADMTDTVAHTFMDEVIESTCTEKGYTVHYCKDCGYQEIINRTDVKAHDWKLTEVIAPTCTQKGYSVFTCAACGIVMKTDETECAAHTPGEWFCDDYAAGHYIQRCEKCYCKLDEKTVTVTINTPTAEGGEQIAQGSTYEMAYGNTVDLAVEGSANRYRYASSDPDVVVINENGEMEAVGAGTAIITVVDDETGISSTFSVKIQKPWWQKVHEVLASFAPMKIVFMLFKVRY